MSVAETSLAGLRFATLLDFQGGCRDLSWDEVCRWTPAQGFLWLHMERDTPLAAEWLQNHSDIDPLVALALLADESRPRVEPVGDNLLVVLRGINAPEHHVEPELMPIHIWGEANRLVSLRDHDDEFSSLRAIHNGLLHGKGPRSPGILLALIAEKIIEQLENVIDDMEEDVDDLEDRVMVSLNEKTFRTELAQIRRQVIHLRRYLGPQRDALYRLSHDDASWLDDSARQRLHEVTNKVIRHMEDLNALRDRTTVLHEDLSTQIAETVSATSNRLTAVATILLPPSLIAGIMGANVGGIPGQSDDIAFWVLCLVIFGLLGGLFVFLKYKRWL